MVCLLGECHVCRMSSLINAQEVSPDDSLHYMPSFLHPSGLLTIRLNRQKVSEKSKKNCIAYIAISFLDCKTFFPF